MSERNIYLKPPTVRGANPHPGLIMSMELHVFLLAAALPSREEWQAGIIEHGFPLKLDEALDIRHHAGFSPAMYWGKKSGFEFNLYPALHIASRYKGVSERIGARDVSASFRWRGNVLEGAMVYTASAVIARLADGILYYPQQGRFATGCEAITFARRFIVTAELN